MDLFDAFNGATLSKQELKTTPQSTKRKVVSIEESPVNELKDVKRNKKEESENVVESPSKINDKIVTNQSNKPPAKTYPYELDGFQKEAISYLERNISVLVAAHTSAGKTTVAEYAIAMALRDKQRVIYTSPIKALSNQKYRDLVEEFSDVGLLTGDVTINPNASCLVMTTEILRSMLYRGSEVIREVAFVVFDEVHYMRDRERGVVWEESIILLPHKVRYVFLSATIPNAQEFCDWIAKVHHQPCHAVYTDYRPTPLQHYMFPTASNGVFLIVDEKGKFHDDTFEKAMGTLEMSNLETEVLGPAEGTSNNRVTKLGDVNSIVSMIMKRNYDPAIVFSFSKRECETFASAVSKQGYTTQEEAQMIREVYHNAIDSLSEADKGLPQITSLLPMLMKGIGIHHGGLLPILKEVTEILFGEGLIKVLFATETFAMGINMPAKTVVFTAMRKYDGHDFRWVNPGEYIQMSGRAGRRGLDERGIVIQMVQEKMDIAQAKEIMNGSANPLSSSFHLGYNMVLNLLRVEDADPEFIMRNSLFAFQQEKEVPLITQKIKDLRESLNEIKIENEEEVQRYLFLKASYEKMMIQLKSSLVANRDIHSKFITPGRLVLLKQKGYAVIDEIDSRLHWLVSVLDDKKRKQLISCKSEDIADIYTTVVSTYVNPPAKKAIHARRAAAAKVLERLSNDNGSVHNVRSLTAKELCNAIDPSLSADVDALEEQIRSNPIELLPNSDSKTDMLEKAKKKQQTRIEIKVLNQSLREKSLGMKEHLRQMKAVLKRLGYIDNDGVLHLKGRVACEISTADELVATQMLFGGAFNNLDPAVVAALLSCLVFQESSGMDLTAPSVGELKHPYLNLLMTARNVANTQHEEGIKIDAAEFSASFKCDLMEPVHAWCQGATFQSICTLTKTFEGSIIRAIRRLVELLRQMCVASRIIGDANLEQTFRKAIDLMKRDIIFAASLYL